MFTGFVCRLIGRQQIESPMLTAWLLVGVPLGPMRHTESGVPDRAVDQNSVAVARHNGRATRLVGRDLSIFIDPEQLQTSRPTRTGCRRQRLGISASAYRPLRDSSAISMPMRRG